MRLSPTTRANPFHRHLAARRTPPGAPPGTLSPGPDAYPSSVDVIAYDAETIEHLSSPTMEEIGAILGRHKVAWVNVSGLADLELIRNFGKLFGLHPLALEDVVNGHQRPKAEAFGDHLFIATRMPLSGDAPETEQVTLFVGSNFVLSFQEQAGDCFDPIRDRITQARGRIRSESPGYLAYALLDAIIDSYFPVLEKLGDRLEDIESNVFSKTGGTSMAMLHGLKRELLHLRRAIWPQRELFNGLIRDPPPQFEETTQVFLRDCYDHAVQLMDIVETDREVVSDLFDLQLSAVNLKMNEVMKVLTIIATVFIPLSFITGLYGMNFSPDVSPYNMPELRWYWGYPYALGIIALCAVGLIVFVWRRGWLSATEGLDDDAPQR